MTTLLHRLALAALLLLPGLGWADIWQAGEAAPGVVLRAVQSGGPASTDAAELPSADSGQRWPSLLQPGPVLSVAGQAPSWWAEMQVAARESKVDVYLLQAIVAAESGFNASAISRFGAVGLMQIMPDTARHVAGLIGNSKVVRQKLLDPQTNVRVGAQYLHRLIALYGERLDLVLAAYNAGVGNVQKAGQRVPPNRETPRFVQKVSQHYASLRAAAQLTEPGAPGERFEARDAYGAPLQSSVSDVP